MKIKSIRTKILLVFSFAFLLLLLLLLMVNKFFLVDYYIKSNRDNMHKSAEIFITNYNKKTLDILQHELIKNTGGEVYLFNERLLLIATNDKKAVPLESDGIPRPPMSDGEALPPKAGAKVPFDIDHIKFVRNQAVIFGEKGHFEVIGQGDIEEQRLMYARIMNNGNLLVITKAMGLVSEASKMFFHFMLRTSIIIYLIGFVVIYVIADSISRPIVKMKRVTHKMANLQFNEKLHVKGHDEMGQLMQSVNKMADELSETIRALNVSNDHLARELSKEKSLEKMRRRFVSDVSHELKNPISMILGYADGLVQKIPKTEEVKEEYYKIIVDEATRMSKLVKDLLDLSGYESGTFTIVEEEFVINELIDNAIERFSYVMNEKNINIEYASNERYTLTADRLRISGVIINLLSNAFKHVDDKGTIKIEVSRKNERLKLLIANTGDLIPEKELDQIWNSFYQIDTENKGNGLGLAIVKSIVKMHKGSCRAYTSDGYNCFEIIL